MARLAGDGLSMSIQTFIGMQLSVMAVGASHLLRRFDGVVIGDEFAFDGMIFCGVAIGALQIVFAHVHVGLGGGIVQTLIEITVLDSVAAAAVKMTVATLLPRRSGYTLRSSSQVNSICRVAILAFAVTTLGVTYQAIYILGFSKIRVSRAFFPTITGMATGAAFLIALRADTKIVDLIYLANGHGFGSSFNGDGFTFPSPM